MTQAAPSVHSGFYRRSGKRLFDVCVAAAGLAILFPLLVLIALLVLLFLGRPILFAQTRSGRQGEPFTLWKFRSMRPGGEGDAGRVTAFGRILRDSGLDELPQLFHVVSGKMSLVGPRALLPEYDALYSPRDARRLELRPGLTGLSQVRGGKWLTWEERLELDAEYVDRAGFILDLKILLATVPALLSSARRRETSPYEFESFAGSGDNAQQGHGNGDGAAR